MAAVTVLAWKSVIKHLQQLTVELTNKDPVATTSTTRKLLQLSDAIGSAASNALPPATVRKLVNELKVRHRKCQDTDCRHFQPRS